MSATREEMIAELDKRVKDKILEPTNANLLKKLILKADNDSEAMMIAQLGTTRKRTGLYYDPRLEPTDDNIRYFKKNESLSLHTDDSKPINKLIIGDNYEALQNLLVQYKGQIDVIYIDPPYGKDSLGEYARTNYENAITRDNLLSMLHPRLQLAKWLLADSGVIFCSIDDKNHAYVKCLFDEVFEERNFVANYLWKKTDTPPNLSKKVRKKYEYILCYGNKLSKSYSFVQGSIDGGDAPLLNSGNPIKEITFPKGSVHFNIEDGTYTWKEGMKVILEDSVVVKDGINQNDFRAKGRWKWDQNMVSTEIENGTYFLVKSSKFSVRYQRIGEKATKAPQNNINSKLGVGTNETGNAEVTSILQEDIFDNPKPSSLIQFLINMTNKDDDIKILDFFAGSGTTGHAVLELNSKDDGKRSFILCQLNENLDKAISSSADKTVIKNQIALCDKYNRPHELSEITAERLRRIITGKCNDGSSDFPWIKNHEAYGGNLDVYTIESVLNKETAEGKTPFDVIDETLYGNEKFESFRQKVNWVCCNFNNAQKSIENDTDWEKRIREI